jgi:dihydropteroate synthase
VTGTAGSRHGAIRAVTADQRITKQGVRIAHMKEAALACIPRALFIRADAEALEVFHRIGVDPYGVEAMLPKMRHYTLLFKGIACRAANVIKQEMLSVGGDAAVARGSVACSVPATDVLLMGTSKQLLRFADKVSGQPFGLHTIGQSVRRIIDNMRKDEFVLKTARREVILTGRTQIMGILNVTPDSFSDGGKLRNSDEAVAYGVRLAEEGADIIDVGGESSRPGAEPVSLEEETARVIPVVKGLAQRVQAAISVDTTKAAVAAAALEAGAEIINDISAMTWDTAMPGVVASTGAAIILMHMRGRPREMQEGCLHYRDLVGEIISFLAERMEDACARGIEEGRIMVDPGLGFGKTGTGSLALIKYLPEFKVLGRPVLAGPSRKSFIGAITGGSPDERLEGTAAAVAAAVLYGVHVVRVHDVLAMRKVVDVAEAIRETPP